MVFHWSLYDSKSSLVCRTLPSILADLNNDVIWMFSIRPPMSKSSSFLSKPLETVPCTPIIIDIPGTLMSTDFLVLWQSLSTYLFFAFFHNPSLVHLNGKICYTESSLFFLLSLNLVFMLGQGYLFLKQKSKRSLCFSLSGTDSGLCIYRLLVCSNFYFLRNSHWITLPGQWCQLVYSHGAILLHLLILWLIVLFLSPHNLHQLFIRLLLILPIIYLVLMALFCATIRRNLISL